MTCSVECRVILGEICVLLNIFAVVSGRKVSNSTGSVVELWQAFFANPDEWWDNRNKKVKC